MNPSYSEAVVKAADGIADAGKTMRVLPATVTLIAGIISDLYGVETRQVVRDMKRRETIAAGKDGR